MEPGAKHRTILIAMDGSDHAQRAFDWYAENLYREGDRVLIVYCAEYRKIAYDPITLMSVDPTLISNLLSEEDHHEKKLAEKFKELVKSRNMEGKLIRYNGHAGEGIIKVAADEDVTLIITGSRGLGMVRRTILGSVSDYVLHHASVPVVVCKD